MLWFNFILRSILILMMCSTQISVVLDWLKENSLAAQPISAHRQYGISVLVTQMSDRLKWRPREMSAVFSD